MQAEIDAGRDLDLDTWNDEMQDMVQVRNITNTHEVEGVFQ